MTLGTRTRTRVGTWNARTLYQSGKLNQLASEAILSLKFSVSVKRVGLDLVKRSLLQVKSSYTLVCKMKMHLMKDMLACF